MIRRWRKGLLAGAGAALLVLIGLLGVAYLVVGNIGAHRERVESYLSAATGGVVRISELSSSWAGAVPELRAVGVRLRDAQDRHTLLRLGEVRLRPKLLPLFRGRLVFRRIVLDRPTVELVRQMDGRIVLGEMEGNGAGAPLSALLAQQQVIVSDGTLIWRDLRDPGRVLTLPGIDLMMRRVQGTRRIQGGARPPETLAQSLRLEGTLSGTSEGGDFAGSLRAEAAGLVLGQLPLALAEVLPVSLAGTLDMQTTLSWREGALTAAHAQARLTKPEIRLRAQNRELRADLLSTTLEWKRGGDGWRLRAWRPEWVRGAERFAPEEITVERTGTQTGVSVRDLDLEGLSGLLLSVALPEERAGWAAQLRPRGRVTEGAAKLEDDWHSTGPSALQLRFRDVAFAAQEKFPGIAGLDGALDYQRPEGRARIESDAVAVELPKSHPLRIEIARLEGDLLWHRTDAGWIVTGQNVSARNADAEFHSGRFALDWPLSADQSPTFKAAVEVKRFEAVRVNAYVPELPKTEKFHAWYARALRGGRAVAGHLEAEGSLFRFPFAQGGGRFVGWARFQDVELDFARGFPVLHAPSVEVGFEDSRLSFRNTDGRLDHSPIREVQVTLPAIFHPGQHVFIEGRAEVGLSDGLTFLEQGPLFKDEEVRAAFGLGKADGKGELVLKVDVPLKVPKDSRVEGSYEFSAVSARFLGRLDAKDIKGRVQFTDRSVTCEAQAADFLGGPVNLKLRTAQPGRPPRLVFDFSGTGAPVRLADAFVPELSGAISGSTPWTGRIETAKGSWKGRVASNLNGVALELPEPFHKGAAVAVPLAVEYAVREGASAQLTARYGEHTGALVFAKSVAGWKLGSGEVSVGERKAAATGGQGLRLRLRQPAFDLDAWLKFVASTFKDRHDGEPLPVVNVRGRTGNLRFLHRDWGPAALSADSLDGVQWTATLNGERFAGSAQANISRRNPAYRLTLAKLHVPANEGEEPTVMENPDAQPKLDITAEDFRYDGRALGRLEIQAQPAHEAWEVGKLTLRHPLLAVTAQGAWSGSGEGLSRFDIMAESADFGAALKTLALDQRVEGGEGKITAQLRWPGAPGKFSKARVEGEVEIDAHRGRFLAMEAGAGRLFGLLNLDALSRRLRLDFTDVFGQGTPFDQFGGKARLERGDLHTDGILIVGPSLYIEASGRIGLVREDFDLDLIVAPPLGGNLSLIGALINPIYGAVMYLTQKVFRKQLARLVYYRYRVVGSWEHPEITRVKHEPEENVNREP